MDDELPLVARVIFENSDDIDFDNCVFRYCEFRGLKRDGGGASSTFMSCHFDDIDWYWGLFNGCLFVDTTFENCVFQGASVFGCRFLNCRFSNCRFLEDNLGGPCRFDESKWYECVLEECLGMPAPDMT